MVPEKYRKKNKISFIRIQNNFYVCLFIEICILGVRVFMVFNGTWQKLECSRKTTHLPQVTDKLYHITLNQVHLPTSVIQTHIVSGDRA
jgi:hypothetical protein